MKQEIKDNRYKELKILVESEGYILHNTEFVNNAEKMDVTCTNGHRREMKVANFRSGRRCRKCWAKKHSVNKTHSTEYIRGEIEHYGYKLLSKEYKGNDKKIKLECDRGHEYETTWIGFNSNKNRCPRCKSSRGENIIRFILNQYGVSHQEQKKVIIDGINYFYDFYLEDYNTHIEFQGEQHFRAIPSRGGEEGFKKQKEKDRIKKQYCLYNNVRLLEYTYWQTPKEIHNEIVRDLDLEYKGIDLFNCELYTTSLDVREMLNYYRWHTNKETTKKYNASESQVSRYSRGTGVKIKPVKQLKDGKVIAIFDSQKEVRETLGVQINGCLKGRNKRASGFEWAYVSQQEYEKWRDTNG